MNFNERNKYVFYWIKNIKLTLCEFINHGYIGYADLIKDEIWNQYEGEIRKEIVHSMYQILDHFCDLVGIARKPINLAEVKHLELEFVED